MFAQAVPQRKEIAIVKGYFIVLVFLRNLKIYPEMHQEQKTDLFLQLPICTLAGERQSIALQS